MSLVYVIILHPYILVFEIYFRPTPLTVKMPFSRQPQAKKLYRQLAELRQQLADHSNTNLRPTTPVLLKEVGQDIDGAVAAPPVESLPLPTYSPLSAAKSLAASIDVTPRPERLKKLLPFTITMDQVASASTTVKKVLFSEEKAIHAPMKYTGVKKLISLKTKLSRDYIFSTSRKRSNKRERQANLHRDTIIEYLKRDDNSYCLPGKKDHVRGVQRYALGDTLRNLHGKFIREFPHMAISMATFTRARPNYIILTRYLQRRVCLCQRHANVALMAEASKVLPRSTTEIVSLTDDEITAKMEEIPVDEVNHHQWEKVDKTYNGKKISKINLVAKSKNKADFIVAFTSILPDFRAHCFRVQEQYHQITYLKENMQNVVEATLQLDYAENWNAKYLFEITSAYYDKNQLSIHPMVLHMKDQDGKISVKSYVGVTEVKSHSAPTTFTFLKALMTQLKFDCPHLQLLHIISDSPSSQYRNRSICDLVSHFPALFSITATWSWLESGHGKGACDGVGGGVKRLADNLIKSKKIITSAEEFVNEVCNAQPNMVLLHIKPQEVEDSTNEIDSWNTPIVKGLSTMHTIVPAQGSILMRETSCFKGCCYENGIFKPSCLGWKNTNLKIHQLSVDVVNDVPSADPVNEAMDQADRADNADQQPPLNTPDQQQPAEFTVGSYVTARYGRKWYLARIDSIHDDESDDEEFSISFMTRANDGWKWGKKRDTCLLPRLYLLKAVLPQEEGKKFTLLPSDVNATNELLNEQIH